MAVIILCSQGCKKDDELPLSEIPSITNVEPPEGTIGTELKITGSNFREGATVYIGDKMSSNTEITTSTEIFASVPSGISANILLSVKVINQSGGEASKNLAFKAIDPVLSFVNSATKPSGNVGSTVILEGKAFGDKQGKGKVLFSDDAGGTIVAEIASEDDWTDEFIVTTVPSGASDGPVVVETEIGTSEEIHFTVTDAATFSPSTINWTETTSLPIGVSGHKALSISVDGQTGETDKYVLVSGGRDEEGKSLDQVFVGRINKDGNIDSWEGTTSMTDAVSFHASVAATPFNSRVDGSGYVYVLGGTDANEEPVNTVSLAALNNDGTLQGWTTTTSLPQPLHSAGAVIFRSTVYIAGGATTGNTSVSNVYKAEINEDGTLGSWETLPSLPEAVAHHGFVSFGGYLYSVGGETGIADPDADSHSEPSAAVYYSRINLRSGEIDNWTVNPNELQKKRSKHTTLVLGGNMFVSSGIYGGLNPNVQGSSENVYANIKSDGTIESFGGATGSNTLYSECGNNLFNQDGINYIDADGVAHVMIIGGARYGSPDTKIDKVLFY